VVIDLMRNRARTLIYSTGLPPAIVAAAIAALDVIEREPVYAALPVQKAKAFARAAGLPEAQSPIVPLVIGEERTTLEASRMLMDLRLTFTAQHPDEEIARLARVIRNKIAVA
jgi:8-amino-7-oxononanoate synthase